LLAALPAAAAAGGLTCDQGPASCDASPPRGAAPMRLADADLDGDGPRYATQAVIDCPAPIAGALLDGLVGECDGTPSDASYRASRDPESERAPNRLRPARRDRGTIRSLAACAGVPSEGDDASPGPAPTQPLALVALPGLPVFFSSRLAIESWSLPPSRQPRPLERPPRA
jgi:hypothetical protein